MADKLVRKLTNKATGAPIADQDVVARPVTSSGTEGEISMPETPQGSGIYATTNQIDHGTYKIVVGGVDSLDEVTVEPGRAKVRSGVSSFLYPLLDRLADVKLILGGLLVDSSATATAAEFRTALLAATASDAVRRPLVLDQDVTLSTSTDVGQDLHLDLNGRTLNLNANITSSTSRITVTGGKINVGAGAKIQGTSTCFVNCEFIGAGASTIAQVDTAMTFAGCSGLTQHNGAENDAGIVASVAGGSHGFGNASSLRLTTKGARTGTGRLVALQNWIDQTLSDTARMNILSWLWAAKAVLDEWVNIPAATRSFLANFYVTGGQVVNATFMASMPTPNVVKKYGVKCGIAITGNANGSAPNMKGCVSITSAVSVDGLTIDVYKSDMKIAESNILQFDDSAGVGKWNAYVRCRSYNPSTGVLADSTNGGTPTAIEVSYNSTYAKYAITFSGITVGIGSWIYDFETTLPGAGADLFSY